MGLASVFGSFFAGATAGAAGLGVGFAALTAIFLAGAAVAVFLVSFVAAALGADLVAFTGTLGAAGFPLATFTGAAFLGVPLVAGFLAGTGFTFVGVPLAAGTFLDAGFDFDGFGGDLAAFLADTSAFLAAGFADFTVTGFDAFFADFFLAMVAEGR